MTVVHPQTLIRQSVYTVLSGDAQLITLVNNRIYANAPKKDLSAGTSGILPIVRIGELTLGDWSSHTFDGFQGTLMMHVWSAASSPDEVEAILNRMYSLLHKLDLGLSAQDFTTLNLRCGLNRWLVEPDGATYHGFQNYNLLMGGN